MRLAQDSTAASEARQYARRWSDDHRLPESFVADLELVVDELVTNAVRYAAAPYDIEILGPDGMVRGEIQDCSDARPVKNTHPDDRGGYGLHIVTSCTSRWGTQSTTDGKQVWFEIDLT
jgi:anti-sigma regulatory factor (Ser/Thr protein kinase)